MADGSTNNNAKAAEEEMRELVAVLSGFKDTFDRFLDMAERLATIGERAMDRLEASSSTGAEEGEAADDLPHHPPAPSASSSVALSTSAPSSSSSSFHYNNQSIAKRSRVVSHDDSGSIVLSASLLNAMNSATSAAAQAAGVAIPNEERIQVVLVDPELNHAKFRIKPTTKLSSLMTAFAKRKGEPDANKFRFSLLNGQLLLPNQTSLDYGLHDGDYIHVHHAAAHHHHHQLQQQQPDDADLNFAL